jgi:hypothetical protein
VSRANRAIWIALDVDHAAIFDKHLLATADGAEWADGDVALGITEARVERLTSLADGIGDKPNMVPECHCLLIPFQNTDRCLIRDQDGGIIAVVLS